jgi:hypothetical protein
VEALAGFGGAIFAMRDNRGNSHSGRIAKSAVSSQKGMTRFQSMLPSAPAAAEIHAGEVEAFERAVPVFADLAAEGERVGVGDDPPARIGFADVDAVGDLEDWLVM